VKKTGLRLAGKPLGAPQASDGSWLQSPVTLAIELDASLSTSNQVARLRLAPQNRKEI
jgi:hypothetical protein